MNQEVWRPVVNHEFYEVSSIGRVRSLPRTVVTARGVRKYKGRVLSPSMHKTGYLAVNIRNATHYVHRLVLAAFVGPCPVGCECCHNNGDRADNRLSNLRWDTFSANQRDRITHGTHNRGERCGMAKLTAKEVKQIRASSEQGKRLAEYFEVSQQLISAVRHNRCWQHI